MRYLIVCFISCLFWAESFGQKRIEKKLRQAPISLTPISILQENFVERKVTSINTDSIKANEEDLLDSVQSTRVGGCIHSVYYYRSGKVIISWGLLAIPISVANTGRSVSLESAGVAILQDYRLSIRGARPDANIVLIDGIRAIEYENVFIPFDEGQSVKVKTQ